MRDQRIGVAESDDLTTWRARRDGGKPWRVDTRWYASLAEDDTASETWRDPFVVRDEAGDGWHMLVAARARGAARLDDGVIAHAWSPDLVHWEARGTGLLARAPASGSSRSRRCASSTGTHVLVFTCHPEEQSSARREEYGDFCTWSMTGDSLLGPWDVSRAAPFRAEPELFAAPLVQQRDGSWAFVGFRNLEPAGILSFEIIDPVPGAPRGRGAGRRRVVRPEPAAPR